MKCPLLSLRRPSHPGYLTEGYIACHQPKCPLWDRAAEQCSINYLGPIAPSLGYFWESIRDKMLQGDEE